jgi:hypothetical protein
MAFGWWAYAGFIFAKARFTEQERRSSYSCVIVTSSFTKGPAGIHCQLQPLLMSGTIFSNTSLSFSICLKGLAALAASCSATFAISHHSIHSARARMKLRPHTVHLLPPDSFFASTRARASYMYTGLCSGRYDARASSCGDRLHAARATSKREGPRDIPLPLGSGGTGESSSSATSNLSWLAWLGNSGPCNNLPLISRKRTWVRA